MRKKILFLMPYLGCGGVESTLFSLLDIIDKEKYDITLMLLEKKGAFLDRIPAGVNIKLIQIPEREQGVFFGKKRILIEYVKNRQVRKLPTALLYNLKNKLSEDRTSNAAYFERIADSIPCLDERFDLAIDYFGYATFTTFYLAEKIHAKVKVSWLHSIMSRFNPVAFRRWYEKMDVIFAVSKMVKQDFEAIFPTAQNVSLFYNIISPELIRQRSMEKGGFEDDFDGVRILTVGRICEEKGIDLAAEAYKKLISEEYRIRWYIIGAGAQKELAAIQESFSSNKEKENFVFLGVKNNPFPYMRQCDIYVQPSRFEGYCTTTNEARIIGCSVVTTRVSGAEEQICNGKTGLIVDKTSEAIHDGVKKLLDHREMCNTFKSNLQLIDCDTRTEVKKMEALLENRSVEVS